MIEYYKNLSLEPLFYINDKGLVCLEEWRDVPDFIGFYQASDLGRAKSLKRMVKGQKGLRVQNERVLSLSNIDGGYLSLSLRKNNKRHCFSLHQIVAITFLRHIPCGHLKIVDHINEIKTDCRLSNLRIITTRKNNSTCRTNKTGIIGINKTPNGKFRSSIIVNKEKIELGSFQTLEEANEVYSKCLSILESGGDISSFRKTKPTSKTGFKNIYCQKGKYFFKKRINGKLYRCDSLENIQDAIDGLKQLTDSLIKV